MCVCFEFWFLQCRLRLFNDFFSTVITLGLFCLENRSQLETELINVQSFHYFSLHSIGSRVPRRLQGYTRACQEIYVRLDPQTYFDTNDIFFPRFIYTIKCAGTPSSPPSCGSSTKCRMHCLTRMGSVTFVRRPRDPRKCLMQRQVVVSGVPVGCYCV